MQLINDWDHKVFSLFKAKRLFSIPNQELTSAKLKSLNN